MKTAPTGLLLSMIFLLALPPLAASGQSTVKNGVNTIVIDPGHGGHDAGAVYGKTYEKNIVLSVALMLGDKIKANYPEVKVVYTRSTDKFVELKTRAGIANKADADLFLSIHVNAARSSAARGTETFVMGLDKQNANMELVMRENSVINLEEDYSTTYEGFDPNDPDSYIIFSLVQYTNGRQSMQLASTIQKYYKRDTSLPDRGARMAPYLVLWYTTMPSVLTELGFISNETDRRLLTTKAGQEKMASCLFNAFSDYKAKVEGRANPVMLPVAQPSTEESGKELPAGSAARKGDGGCYFSVQVCSSPTKVPKNHHTFGRYRGQVTERIIGGRYRYYVGECRSYSEATRLLAEVKKSIKDAFLVAFDDQGQISVPEARKRLK